jgi:hypothetical protein
MAASTHQIEGKVSNQLRIGDDKMGHPRTVAADGARASACPHELANYFPLAKSLKRRLAPQDAIVEVRTTMF